VAAGVVRAVAVQNRASDAVDNGAQAAADRLAGLPTPTKDERKPATAHRPVFS